MHREHSRTCRPIEISGVGRLLFEVFVSVQGNNSPVRIFLATWRLSTYWRCSDENIFAQVFFVRRF